MSLLAAAILISLNFLARDSPSRSGCTRKNQGLALQKLTYLSPVRHDISRGQGDEKVYLCRPSRRMTDERRLVPNMTMGGFLVVTTSGLFDVVDDCRLSGNVG